MTIEERKVTIGELCEGYFNDAEEGVVGYGEHYNSRFVNQSMTCAVFE